MNVVGSNCTATHGSGHKLPVHADNVTAIEMVTPKGEVLHLTKEKTPNFKNYIINFGAVGIITKMSMEIERSYMIRKSIYSDLKWDVLFKNYNEVMESSYNIALFVDYPNRSMR